MIEYKQAGSVYKPLWLAAMLLFVVWFGFAYLGLYTAVQIWYGNEIFNHGFLVVPGAIYFAYVKRSEWVTKPIRSTFWALPFLFAGILVYVIGYAGDIQLFMHAAAFGLLPVVVWMLVGHQAAWTLIFPFCFLVFAIPVGEQLIPWLQEVTADISVYMLQLTGVPLYRSGLYIEIPQGRFLVAEACSGISFFIASMVVGAVYSFLNFNRAKKRIGFFALSVVYPIFANAIRVYGIILIGYRTNMEHAVGADHLIYGWFFFAFVLVSLLGIGELMRDKNTLSSGSGDTAQPLHDNQTTPTVYISKWLVGIATVSFLCSIGWISWINSQQHIRALEPAEYLSLPSDFYKSNATGSADYSPALSKVSERLVGFRDSESGYKDIIYQAWFDGKSNELVSGLHRLYDEKAWSLVSQRSISLSSGQTLRVKEISDPLGHKRLVVYWYMIDSKLFTDDTSSKLYQTANALVGGGDSGLRVIVSVSVNRDDNNRSIATMRLEKIIEKILSEDISQ